MKLISLITVMIVFIITIQAQKQLPIIKSNANVIDVQDGKNLKKKGWTLTPEAKPDVYEAELINGKPHKVTFITDVDSISFTVEEGKKYDFIIQKGDALCYTQIVGTKFVPAAVFDEKYRKSRKGKAFVDIPEVYELVNIAIAMTPTGIADKNLVNQKTDYYQKMRVWFDPFQNHPLLAALDIELKKNLDNYYNLKNNGYSFVFDKKGKIVQSKVFNRTGWGKLNTLHPFWEQLQSFSDVTNFLKFYQQNRKTYNEQIAFYRDTANIAEMKRWLDKNFPTSNDYDTYNIIFSPLVNQSQNTSWFISNGFKELQPHVNYPYPQDFESFVKSTGISEKSLNLIRGNIVFTEINHGYINPEAEKYAERIAKAISNRDLWVDKKMGANYYPGISAFNEYLNWALINLRIVDYVSVEEQAKLLDRIDGIMTKGRGFPQFDKFNKFLINLYRNRKPNQTLADLYPQIIEWFERNNNTQS